MISAIVLAAGLSSRMEGENKLLLGYKDKTIIQQTIESVLAGEVMEVVVVVGHQKENICKIIDDNNYPVKVVENNNYESGMTSSIKTGIKNASPFCDGYMVCMGDMPLLEPSHYNSIVLASRKAFIKDPDCIVIPYFDKRRGNPVIFSVKYKNDLLNHDQPEGCREIAEKNPDHIVKVSLDTGISVLDVDRKEDYQTIS